MASYVPTHARPPAAARRRHGAAATHGSQPGLRPGALLLETADLFLTRQGPPDVVDAVEQAVLPELVHLEPEGGLCQGTELQFVLKMNNGHSSCS